MADAVAVSVIHNTTTHYVIHCTSISDGTGESAVVKADKSALTTSDGAEPASLDIEKVTWCCDGMAVKIYWEHDTDDLALALSGSGECDFKGKVGDVDQLHRSLGLKDPRSTGGTGDLIFTTSGHSSGDTYNVTLWLRKNPD